MSDLDKLFNEALKKPEASAVTESGNVVKLDTPANEVTQVTAPEAETPVAVPPIPGLPWEGVDPRILSFFQIRMPEPLKKKIEWLELQRLLRGERSNSRGMKHEIALSALEREIDRLVAKELKGK